jgi:glycogen(starch) synthase
MSSQDSSASGQKLNENALLFEVAWEVCNQIGGIYTVIKTKAPAMMQRWNERYCLIGPYKPETAAIEFEQCEAPIYLKRTIARLNDQGLPCHYGRWLVNGRPHVLLIDHRQRHARLDEDKYYCWRDHGIEAPREDPEVNDAIAFGFCVYEFFRELAGQVSMSQGSMPLIAHFHEWLAGIAVARLRYLNVPVATVFTTHATLLGRYMAGDNPSFYDALEHIDPYATAKHYNIFARYLIERAAANAAHVFTTISDITGKEAERLLGRKPDLILPNGLNVQRFTAMHEFQNLHLRFKERINEFVMGHFFPSYTFDLDRTLYVFTSGRYEYRNKGIDVFIESLHRLNQRLKALQDPPTVVAFIVTQAATKNVNVSALQNHLMFDELKGICNEIQVGVERRLLSCVARRRMPTYEELLPNDHQVRLKRVMYALKSRRLPAIVTHDLCDDAQDPILRHLRHRSLFNSPADPVKVIFHPEFITATSPLFGLDYDQFVRGCHLGVFPSYYEPWGYTPLECIALGLPAVTTDLSGFGGYVERHINNPQDHGIYVLPRARSSTDSSIEQLSNYLLSFTQLSRRDRIELRNKAERLTDAFDWTTLALHYQNAHLLALSRRG